MGGNGDEQSGRPSRSVYDSSDALFQLQADDRDGGRFPSRVPTVLRITSTWEVTAMNSPVDPHAPSTTRLTHYFSCRLINEDECKVRHRPCFGHHKRFWVAEREPAPLSPMTKVKPETARNIARKSPPDRGTSPERFAASGNSQGDSPSIPTLKCWSRCSRAGRARQFQDAPILAVGCHPTGPIWLNGRPVFFGSRFDIRVI